MDGYLPVKVMVPLDAYKRLHVEANMRGIGIAERIAEVLDPPQHGGHRRGAGRPSAYTTKAGEEISAGRRFHMSWADICRQFEISDHTARAWLAKYENEVREQNARDRAERKSA